MIPEKVFKARSICPRPCKANCSQKIDIERQVEIHQMYYKLEDWSRKRLYVRSLVSNTEKTVTNPVGPMKRQQSSFVYHLNDANGNNHRVCLQFILGCLQITKSSFYRAIVSNASNPNAVDLRGSSKNRKTSEEDVDFVKSFIHQFPRYQSHYKNLNSNSTAEYLSPTINLSRMYQEYCKAIRNSENRNLLSQWKFRHIFNTKFNLKFKRLKVDTCKTCDALENSLKSPNNNRALLLAEKQNHHLMVEKTRSEFKDALAEGKDSNKHVEVRTFDLQRALELPCLSTSVAYYKRQLWQYNLCVFDEVRQMGFMYTWPESVASRGAQEIGSCLIRHLRDTLPPTTKPLILHSDSCPGQNKNIKLSLMLIKFLESWPYPELQLIEQRFFIVGHSYNSCDRCFGLIEKQKKKTEDIFIPRHWVNVMKAAKQFDPKFCVREMEIKDFFSSKLLEDAINNRKKTIDNLSINWFNFQNISYQRNDLFTLRFKNYSSIIAPTMQISLRKNLVIHSMSSINLPYLRRYGNKITKQKYEDLKALLQYVPEQYHEFYKSLKVDNSKSTEYF